MSPGGMAQIILFYLQTTELLNPFLLSNYLSDLRTQFSSFNLHIGDLRCVTTLRPIFANEMYAFIMRMIMPLLLCLVFTVLLISRVLSQRVLYSLCCEKWSSKEKKGIATRRLLSAVRNRSGYTGESEPEGFF